MTVPGESCASRPSRATAGCRTRPVGSGRPGRPTGPTGASMGEVAQGARLWPAIWMLPTDWVYGGWAASGEIDIMEWWPRAEPRPRHPHYSSTSTTPPPGPATRSRAATSATPSTPSRSVSPPRSAGTWTTCTTRPRTRGGRVGALPCSVRSPLPPAPQRGRGRQLARQPQRLDPVPPGDGDRLGARLPGGHGHPRVRAALRRHGPCRPARQRLVRLQRLHRGRHPGRRHQRTPALRGRDRVPGGLLRLGGQRRVHGRLRAHRAHEPGGRDPLRAVGPPRRGVGRDARAQPPGGRQRGRRHPGEPRRSTDSRRCSRSGGRAPTWSRGAGGSTSPSR